MEGKKKVEGRRCGSKEEEKGSKKVNKNGESSEKDRRQKVQKEG